LAERAVCKKPIFGGLNFIAHYFFTHRAGEHYYNLGTVLPDLTRNFVKGARIAPHKVQPTIAAHVGLNDGSAAHYALDRMFHHSTFFNTSYEHIRSLTREAGFDATFPRYFFFNHIFLELMLDRYLVMHHHPVIDAFYHSLQLTESAPVGEFLQLHNIAADEEFFVKFDRFREVKYLYHYADNEKLIYSLNRIMMQVGLFGLNVENKDRLLPVMEQTDHWMQQQFSALEEEVNLFLTQQI
jgi:hypothetical protein